MSENKGVVVLSGGLDSTTLLYYLTKEVNYELYPIVFNYGQKHSREIKFAMYHTNKLRREGYKVHRPRLVNLRFLKSMKSALTSSSIEVPTLEEVIGEPQPITYVPFRNMIFLSIALSYAECNDCDVVFYGAQKQDEFSGYWDTTEYFLEAINNVAKLNRQHKIEVKAPFVNLSKAEIVFVGSKLGVEFDKTWSCYKGDTKPCGQCSTCRERIMAFARVGLKDPLPYQTAVDWDSLISQYKCSFDYNEIKRKIDGVLH